MIWSYLSKSAFPVRDGLAHGGIYIGLFCVAVSCGLIGCAKHNYKGEADETVYKIIDQKWQEEFG
jgi:hypothetical protein